MRALPGGGTETVAQAAKDASVTDAEAVALAALGRRVEQHFGSPQDVEWALDAAGTAWGIVTNKPEYLARQILPQLGWETRCAVLIGGDSLAERKPHPLPLLVAAQRLGRDVAGCVYVGDDDVRFIGGLDAEITGGARISIIPAVAGG